MISSYNGDSVMKKISIMAAVFFLTFVGVISFVTSVIHAETPIAKGYYTTDNDLKAGMAVALSSNSTDQKQWVERASLQNKAKYLGIATSINGNVVTITSGGATVYVATNGQNPVYVSNLAGTVKKGDALTLSPLKGVLMKKAEKTTGTTVAIALADANEASSQVITQQIVNNGGDSRTVKIETVQAEISLGAVPAQEPQNTVLTTIGESLTGRPLSNMRVIIAGVILLATLFIEGSIIYAAVSSSITATGRNPLSKNMIYKELFSTAGISVVILAVSIFSLFVVIFT